MWSPGMPWSLGTLKTVTLNAPQEDPIEHGSNWANRNRPPDAARRRCLPNPSIRLEPLSDA